MVKYSSGALDVVFSALSDPTRRAILRRLARGEACVTELARPFDLSLPAISKHLRVLEEAGLLGRKKEGRVHRCRLEAAPMREAAMWIVNHTRFWNERLDALEAYLRKSDGPTPEKEENRCPPLTPDPKQPSRSRGPSRLRGRKSSGRSPSRRR